jgi:hypothetical protein
MENEFERYLQEHRDRFEPDQPSAQVWEKLQDGLIRHHRNEARIIRIRRMSYGVAASVLLCLGLFILLPKNKGTVNRPGLVRVSKPDYNVRPTLQDSNNTLKELVITKTEKKRKQDSFRLADRQTRQSLFYYTRLIGIRQQQISLIQNIDPDLYKKSQKGIEDLNQGYNHLKNQLPGSINRQKVLELMIQNLQLQEQILNNQLQLIKSLQSPNPSEHEKAVKNI